MNKQREAFERWLESDGPDEFVTDEDKETWFNVIKDFTEWQAAQQPAQAEPGRVVSQLMEVMVWISVNRYDCCPGGKEAWENLTNVEAALNAQQPAQAEPCSECGKPLTENHARYCAECVSDVIGTQCHRDVRSAQAEPTSEVAEYQNALEKGLTLICSAVGLESEHYDDDSKTDVENYLDCFADAANWLEHCVYWDRDAGCIVISKPPKAEPVSWVKYTVQPAESLAGIAIRQLGDESRAGEIGLLNNVPCEDAPLYPFEPGDVIRLPILAPQPPKAVPDEWFETINRSVGNMEYAAYNLCDGIDMSRFEGDNWFTTESTCPEASLLIAIRDIKALITPPSHTTPDDQT